MDKKVSLARALVLNLRPYRNTSALVEVFAREYGRLTLIAKGVRSQGSRFQGLLQPFSELSLSWQGHSELKTMTYVESLQPIWLQGVKLYCGLYLNELLMKLTHRFDPHPQLYDQYLSTLERLVQAADVEVLLRCFEVDLLREVGYGLALDEWRRPDQSADPQKFYIFDLQQGLIPLNQPADARRPAGAVSEKTLECMACNDYSNAQTRLEAKHFMRSVIDSHLGGQPLQARMLFVKPAATSDAISH